MAIEEHTLSLSPWTGTIAKYGATLCMAALGSAFVFDYTFWLLIDPRLLSYFVFADHLQTAVRIFGLVSIVLAASWLLTMVVVYARFAVTKSEDVWKVATPLLVLIFCVLGLLAILFHYPSFDLFDRTVFVAMFAGLGAMAMLAPVFHRSTATEDDIALHHRPSFLRRTLWAIAPLCLFLSMADAVFHAWNTNDGRSASRDAVHLADNSTVSASIIRLVDRGVILRAKDGRVVFVPKEQIRYIDHKLPPGTEA
jgi:hypothetical protein